MTGLLPGSRGVLGSLARFPIPGRRRPIMVSPGEDGIADRVERGGAKPLSEPELCRLMAAYHRARDDYREALTASLAALRENPGASALLPVVHANLRVAQREWVAARAALTSGWEALGRPRKPPRSR